MIPLGILGNRRGGAAGAYELISTAYGTGSSGTITFSSIPSTYKHLQLRWVAQNTSTGTTVNLTLNSDSGTNYATHQLLGNATAVSSSAAGISDTKIYLSRSMGNSTTTFASAVIDILDFSSTSKNKTIRSFNGITFTGANYVYLTSGLWLNTSAVTSLTLTANAGNFSSLSRFSLYGIKG